MDLDASEAVRQLEYRYFRTLDLERWDEFADTLAVDVAGRYGTHALDEPITLDGRDAVTEFMREHLGPTVVTVHIANHPEITVDGETAAGSLAFEDTMLETHTGCGFAARATTPTPIGSTTTGNGASPRPAISASTNPYARSPIPRVSSC